MRSVAIVASVVVGCAMPPPRAAPSAAPHLATSDSIETEGKPAARLPPRAPPPPEPTVPFECRDFIGHCENHDLPPDLGPPPKPKSPPPTDTTPGTKL